MSPKQSEDLRIHFMNEVRHFFGRDHSGVVAVLKAHLIAEQMMNAILLFNFEWNDEELSKQRFTFAQKTSLVVASESLTPEVRKSLLALNKIRNKCAHQFSFELKQEHWIEIFDPFQHEMPYQQAVPEGEDQKWMRWSFWLLGLLFPTAEAYASET